MGFTLNDLTFIIIYLPAGILLVFMPYLTRRTDVFGVTVPLEAASSLDIMSKKRKYAASSLSLLILLFLIYLFIRSGSTPLFPVVLLLIFMTGSFAIYGLFHIQMKKMKIDHQWEKINTQQIVIDTAFRNVKTVYSLWWYLIPLVLSLMTLGLTLFMYDRIPASIPVHFDGKGHITAYTEKSSRFLYLNIAFQVYITALFAFLHGMIGRAKQQISPEDPENSMIKNRLFRKRWSLYMILAAIVMVLTFGIDQMALILSWSSEVILASAMTGAGLLLLGAIFLSITTGQGGSRIKSSGTSQKNVMRRDDDRFWKMGQIYINREDPSLFVEKRFGVGWTLNFAHPLSYITLIVIILLSVILPLIFS